MVNVSVIILNWNQADFTVDCVRSVLKQSYTDFQILVVDNASSDDSVNKLKIAFDSNKKVKLIVNKKNLGYAGGNNVGVKNSKSKYVVILNNDTEVEKDWLKVLVESIESAKDIGSISSLEIREGVEEKIDFKKTGFANTITGYPARRKLKEPLKDTSLIPLFSVRGVSFIYKRALVKLPFDPDYFIYAEDYYLGWILRLKGYRNFYATKSVVNHYHNLTKKSSTKINTYFTFLGERNRFINFFLFWEKKNIWKLLPPVLVQILLANIFEPRKFPSRIKAYWWLLTNIPTLKKKRKVVQKHRTIGDEKILEHLTYKVYDDYFVKNPIFNFILKVVNFFSYLYFKLVGIRSIEM